jgi:general secretion pathway protein B
MSYILDALKKSERERPPGPVPDLFTVHGPQPPAPRKPARAIVAAALLLAVAALALWAWTGTGRREERDVRSEVAAVPQPRAEVPAVPAAPDTVAAPRPPVPAPAVAVKADAGRKPFGKQPQTPAPLAQHSSRAVAPPEAANAVPVLSPVSALPAPGPAPEPAPAATLTPVPAVSTATPPEPAMPAPTAVPPPTQAAEPVSPAPMQPSLLPSPGLPAAPPVTSPQPVPAVPASVQAPPADGRVLDLSELPASIRAELPKLLVSGHVWSEEAALRLLSVDDRLLHEGGEAAPGVNLEEITPSGAVFAYKGWRFRVAGGRP